jgi:N-acetyl-anhydromuramyl-L-alanine amidase AmpD
MVQHTVAPGETLWRISQIYDVPLATIMRANQIDDKTKLTMGQKLRIPQARTPHQPIPLIPSDKWKYIVLHHTATEAGSSLDFHKSHLAKGWDRGVGYHFVINNGEGEKQDGFVEVTPRWLKQEDGAHCRADDMNTKGIGISLVGNFNDQSVTKAQMDSLVDLVNELRQYYRIPSVHILGHKHVQGSSTECPGRNFPWTEFQRRLKNSPPHRHSRF